MCRIEGCNDKSVARDLCAKHYMRWRRTGDPNTKNKRGPKPVQEFKWMRSGPLSEESPRTQARFIQSMKLLYSLGGDKAAIMQAIKDAERPNRSLNFSKLNRIAWKLYFERFG